MTDKQIIAAIRKLQSEAAEEQPEVSTGYWKRFLNWADRFLESKHVDFLVSTFQALIYGIISFYIPELIIAFFPKMSVQFAESIQALGIAGFQFFMLKIIIDFAIYSSEKVIYNFIKRNGDNTFDFQESLKDLNPYQKCIIAYLKYTSYLFLFAYLLK